MLSSVRPDLTIAAQIAFEGGYDPCNNDTFFLGQDSNRKKRNTNEICDPNFEADEENGYCYLSIEKTLGPQTVSNGTDYCNTYSAELLTFENDAQVEGFLQLYLSGKM